MLWALVLSLGPCGGRVASDAPVEVRVDLDGPTRPISPHIYGINGAQNAPAGAPFTLVRFGGTRSSTYDWENNASNAGHDPPAYQNDGYLHPSEEPAAAALAVLEAARRLGGAALVTVPTLGRVAADRRADGDVRRSGPDFLRTRFVRSVARCDEDEPVLDDGRVCQHAYVRRIHRASAELGVPVYFALDNEPGGWAATHAALRGDRRLTYAELIARSVEYGRMVHAEAPGAPLLGPVSFGWPAMTRLANAPDARGRHFLDVYLSEMARRGAPIDVLDVHWYPLVSVGGHAVTEAGDAPALARARMQSSRSLWDPSYVEPSWITRDELDGRPIELLARLRRHARRVSGRTGIAITEWAYGGGAHPSGAVAVADALGAFGRHGVRAAAYWPLIGQRHDYAYAAFEMFRGFGDRSIEARSSDPEHASAWASRAPDGALVLMLVHRRDVPAPVRVSVPRPMRCEVRALDAERRAPRERPEAALPGELELGARSVTRLRCTEAPAP